MINGVATITADLHRVMHIAWSVSIAAKNAMVFAAQAGERARGFQPLTRFIDEIARDTIDNTRSVEREAVQLTRLAAHHLRTRDACLRFTRVRDKAGDAPHLGSFLPALVRGDGRLREQAGCLQQQLRRLDELMRRDLNMRAALTVASVCRIEATHAGEFRADLSVVADDLERAAHEIRAMVRQGHERIDVIIHLIGERV